MDRGLDSFVELKGLETTTVWCVVGVPDTDYLLSASGDKVNCNILWDMQVVTGLYSTAMEN